MANTPPGFPPLKSISTAKEEEIAFCGPMRGQKKHDFSNAQVHNIVPPPESRVPPPSVPPVHRRRGRPPKSLPPQYSSLHQEVTISPDKFSTAPSTRPLEPSVHHHQGEQSTNSKRKRDYINVDQNPADTTHHASVTFQDQSIRQTNSKPDRDVDLNQILDAINHKYGDITRNCLLESDKMKTSLSLDICKVVRELQYKRLKDVVDVTILDSYYKDVRDAEKLRMNVQWLHNRLDEIRDAIRSINEAKGLIDEKNRRMDDILVKKKAIVVRQVEHKRIESEIRDMEDQLVLRKGELNKIGSEINEMEYELAQECGVVKDLNKNIGVRETEFSRLEHYSSLMDGII